MFYLQSFFEITALKHPNFIAVNDHGKKITYKNLDIMANKLANLIVKLNLNTSKLLKFLKKLNIKKGDRVAAYMPNTIETVEAFIATTSLGGIWSSCSPDFGSKGVIERFSQINPKVLFITDQYFYNGKKIDILNRLPDILKLIPSIKSVVISNYPGKKFIKNKYKFKKINLFKWKEYNFIKII